MRKLQLILMLVILFFELSSAQEKNQISKFQGDIETIQKMDKIYKTLENPIVFVGSTSISKWSGLNVAFGKYNVLNRGIAGTSINDINYYLNDLVIKYKPRQVVIFVGVNDFVDELATPDTVLNRTVNMINNIRAKLPNVPIAYISIQGAPSRASHIDRIKEANKLIKKYLSTEKNTSFIDVFNPLLNKNGQLREELFIEDRLHLTAEGYKIWIKQIEPYLLKQ
jgi:lysophospholipase L1-like esterase